MASCRCGTEWTGHRMEHCPSCHRTFSGSTAGDKHRTGDHAVSTGSKRRRCKTTDELLVSGLTPRRSKSGLEVWGAEGQNPFKSPSRQKSEGLPGEAEGDGLGGGSLMAQRNGRDPLAVLRNQAGIHATAAHARGDETERRRWLDVLILLDQHDEDRERTSQPTESDEEAR